MGHLFLFSAGLLPSSRTALCLWQKATSGYPSLQSGVRSLAEDCCQKGQCLTHSREELAEQGTDFWLAGSLSGFLPSHTLCLTVPAHRADSRICEKICCSSLQK